MGEFEAFQASVTIFGVFGILAFVFLFFCRYLGGWTLVSAWLTSSPEEKIHLTRNHMYNSNGFMILSDSERTLLRGGTQEKPLNDYQLLRQTSTGSLTRNEDLPIPPQPLRPAPTPPTFSTLTIPSGSNSKGREMPQVEEKAFKDPRPFDSLFLHEVPKCPPPVETGNGEMKGPELSATNPFLPILQASSNLISQTFSTFQSFQTLRENGGARGEWKGDDNKTIVEKAQLTGLSIGEILFSSSDPPYQTLPPFFDQSVAEVGSAVGSGGIPHSFEGRGKEGGGEGFFSPRRILERSLEAEMSSLPTSGRKKNGRFKSTNPFEYPIESSYYEYTEEYDQLPLSRKSLEERELESMREEIRVEKEKIADATKSLMMDNEFEDMKRPNGSKVPLEEQPAKFTGLGTNSHDCKDQLGEKMGRTLGSSLDVIGETTTPPYNEPLTSSCGALWKNPLNSFETAEEKEPPRPTQHVTNSIHLLRSARSASLRQASSESGGSEDLTSPESSFPALQRAMSCDSVCSDTSVVLEGEVDTHTTHITGQLLVGVEYDTEAADLLVNVIECKDLVGLDPDPNLPFDSYVRVYLLPDKTTNMQTRVYRKSQNPVYKEKFMFGLEISELHSRSLVFYLYATNKFSNTLIGETELKLGEFDILNPLSIWLPLTDTSQRGGELGEMMFSLSYLPTAERLTVVVVKARNLKFPHERETGDPFVKVYLLQKGKKVSKKKSSTKRGEKNPIFNEAMIFSVPAHALQTIQLRITVADSSEAEGRSSARQFPEGRAYSVGHVIVGSMSTGKPLSHWNQMLSSLRKPIAMWHSLRK